MSPDELLPAGGTMMGHGVGFPSWVGMHDTMASNDCFCQEDSWTRESRKAKTGAPAVDTILHVR